MDSRSVSPVIGVILMVAITVILSAIIATFVMDLSSDISENQPNSHFDFSQDPESGVVTVSHAGGESLRVSSIQVVGSNWSGLSGEQTGLWWHEYTGAEYSDSSNSIRAGDSLQVEIEDSDAIIRIIYHSETSDNTFILAEWKA